MSYNFADLSAQIQYNPNPAPQVYFPRLQNALDGGKQAYCVEEFKCFVKSFYDQNQQSFTNGLMNMVKDQWFQPLVKVYLHCLANANATNPQNFNNADWRRGLALSVIILSQNGQAYCEQVKREVNNNGPQWYQNTANTINTLNLAQMIANNVKYMQQLESQGGMGMGGSGMGMGNSNGMGMGMNNNTSGGGLRPNDFNGNTATNNNNGGGRTLGTALQEMQGGQAATPQASNSYSDQTMAAFAGVKPNQLPKSNTQAQTAPQSTNNPLLLAQQQQQQAQVQIEAVQETPVVMSEPTSAVGDMEYVTVESGVVNNGDGSVCINPEHPDYAKIYRARYAKKAGWMVNVQPPYHNETERTEFQDFEWHTKYGTVTQDTQLQPTALADGNKLMEKYKRELLDLELEIAEHYPQYDNITDCPQYYDKLASLDNGHNIAVRTLYFGALLGPQVLNTETKPWSINCLSSAEALNKVLSPTVQQTLDDEDILLVNLFNREYYLVDSRKPYVNELMVQARNEIDPLRWTHRDNTAAAGHYYLINPYAVRGDRELVVEDFYDLGEYMIDVKRYMMKPMNSAAWKCEDEDGQEFFMTGSEEAELRVCLVEKEFHNMSPVQVADAMRDVLHARRHTDWDSSVIRGSTLTEMSWVITCTERDRKFWNKLQEEIASGGILSVEDLGDFLAKGVEDTTITQRLIRMLDGRIMKEMNILFNDVLGFNPTVVIEESFIKEYKDLIEIIEDESTPTMARAMFGRGVSNIIAGLVSQELTDEELAEYKRNSPFEIEGDKVKFGNNHEVEIRKAVRGIRKETAIVVLPCTANALGLDVHSNTGMVSWNHLPTAVRNILNAYLRNTQIKTILVTSDNYTLAVNGINDTITSGTISAVR